MPGGLDQFSFAHNWPNDVGFDTVREEREQISLKLTGTIPLYAAGTLYRNGPGAREARDKDGNVRYSVSHWFDGFAQLHKFELLPGIDRIEGVRYSSRFNTDSLMTETASNGSHSGYTFAQKRDPCMSLFRKIMCLFTPVPKPTAETANIPVTISANAVGFPMTYKKTFHDANEVVSEYLIARTDESHIKVIDPRTLEPIGIASQRELHPLLTGPLSASHAKSDPESGDVFNYNLDLGYESIYRIFKTSSTTGETEILATVSGPAFKPAYMHSFFLTQNFVILLIGSAHLRAGGVGVLWEKNILDAIAPFDSTQLAQWLVIDRRHGRGLAAVFESPAMFCFHTINAYEVHEDQNDNNSVDIICDLIQYDNIDILHKFYYEHLRSSSSAATQWMHYQQAGCNQHFARYKLTSIGSINHLPSLTPTERESKCVLPVTREARLVFTIPNPIAGDMPNINPKHATKPYRYFWNCTFDSSRSTFVDGLCKVDVQDKTAVRWNNPVGHSPGEAIFIPNPEALDEDDGILLTVVLDGFKESSYLLCLNAKTMEETGRADCCGPIAFLFHGQHVTSSRPLDL